MNNDYIEAILIWSPRGLKSSVEKWFASRSLQTIPMRSGLLVTGNRIAFEEAFGIRLSDMEPPVNLPVPSDLTEAVSSIVIPKLPKFGKPERR